MGWFRRRNPLEEEIDDQIRPKTYVSLTSGRKVVGNLDEIIKDTHKRNEAQAKKYEYNSWGLGENEFISNMTPEIALRYDHQLRARTLKVFWIITGLIFSLMIYINITSSDHPIRMVIISSIIIVIFIVGALSVSSRARKNEKAELEKLNLDDPGYRNCVISILYDRLLVEYDNGYMIYENEVYYDEIDSIEMNGTGYLRNTGVKIDLPDSGSKMKMAPHPGHIRGGLYPFKTPVDQIIVICLKDPIPMNCFKAPDAWNVSIDPDHEISSDQLVISIRDHDKLIFKDSLTEKIGIPPIRKSEKKEEVEDYWY